MVLALLDTLLCITDGAEPKILCLLSMMKSFQDYDAPDDIQETIASVVKLKNTAQVCCDSLYYFVLSYDENLSGL